MKLFNFVEMIQCRKGGMQFRLNDKTYVLNSIKPAVVNNTAEVIILGLHEDYDFTSMKDFSQYCINNLKENLCYELFFEIDDKLYDFSEIPIREFFMSSNLAFILKDYTPKVEDYATLRELLGYARTLGVASFGYDFGNAKIIINVDGVAHQLKFKDVHLFGKSCIDKEDDYSVVLDVKTK